MNAAASTAQFIAAGFFMAVIYGACWSARKAVRRHFHI